MTDRSVQPVVVVTGASAGIGKATARAFAVLGYHVIGTGRDRERSAAAEAEIRAAAAPLARVDFLRGDLCEMTDVARIAGEIAGLTDRIDTLINNAGGVRDKRYVSSDGLEATMAANHFAPFLLTRRLLPLLARAAATGEAGDVRVLVVASSAHDVCPGMRWDDLMWERDYAANPIYCQAKLANLLFARELDRRVASDGITVQSMHPGVVHSNFASHADDFMQDYLAKAEGHQPEHAAETLLWLATAPENGVAGGRYFYDLKEARPAPQALDDAAAARLWNETEAVLAKLGYP